MNELSSNNTFLEQRLIEEKQTNLIKIITPRTFFQRFKQSFIEYGSALGILFGSLSCVGGSSGGGGSGDGTGGGCRYGREWDEETQECIEPGGNGNPRDMGGYDPGNRRDIIRLDSSTQDQRDCTHHARIICYDGNSHWENSCGELEELVEDCGMQACVDGHCLGSYTESDAGLDSEQDCTSHARTFCYGGDIYWANSCGGWEGIAENCTRDQYCDDSRRNARCVEMGTDVGYSDADAAYSDAGTDSNVIDCDIYYHDPSLSCCPSRYFCDDNELRMCSADGQSSSLVEICTVCIVNDTGVEGTCRD